MPRPYVGRFAPSPSGPLHAGSLVAALASYLDARAHAGRWLLRIEDVDVPRTVPGADQVIMRQLTRLGMRWSGEVWYQSSRDAMYQAALDRLASTGQVYGCACTRREIAEAAQRAGMVGHAQERPYLGMCRQGPVQGRAPRAWRVRMRDGVVCFNDRWLGRQCHDVARETGDIVVRRADGLWAYQLAVVVDDIAQAVTHVVRGADLLSSTGRQFLLAELLGTEPPSVMHVPLVMDEATGLKLSKQNHAPALDVSNPVAALNAAFVRLGFDAVYAADVDTFWAQATAQWANRFVLSGAMGRPDAYRTTGGGSTA